MRDLAYQPKIGSGSSSPSSARARLSKRTYRAMGSDSLFVNPWLSRMVAPSGSTNDPAGVPASPSCCLCRCAPGNSDNGRELKVEGMTQQTILVVDDEAPMRRLIASNLKVSGYDVHTAADGTEALKLIAEHPFDLLLLDISLPGPDGLQVLDAIRH